MLSRAPATERWIRAVHGLIVVVLATLGVLYLDHHGAPTWLTPVLIALVWFGSLWTFLSRDDERAELRRSRSG